MRDSSAVRINTLTDPIDKKLSKSQTTPSRESRRKRTLDDWERQELSKSGHRARESEERTLDDWERQKLSKSRTQSERVGGEDAGRLGKTETI